MSSRSKISDSFNYFFIYLFVFILEFLGFNDVVFMDFTGRKLFLNTLYVFLSFHKGCETLFFFFDSFLLLKFTHIYNLNRLFLKFHR